MFKFVPGASILSENPSPIVQLSGCTKSNMSPPAHEIVVVPPEDETRRKECYNVRIQVFVHEQGFPLDVEIDESVLGERFRKRPPFLNLPTNSICFQI
jgi:hypothetical protein